MHDLYEKNCKTWLQDIKIENYMMFLDEKNEYYKYVKLIYGSKCNPNLNGIFKIFDSVMKKFIWRQKYTQNAKKDHKEEESSMNMGPTSYKFLSYHKIRWCD